MRKIRKTYGNVPGLSLDDYGPSPEQAEQLWNESDLPGMTEVDVDTLYEGEDLLTVDPQIRPSGPMTIMPKRPGITTGLLSLFPSWYQAPWDLNLRPKRMGIVYTPEIFGIPYFPGADVSDSDWARFLLAMHKAYAKMYALIASHPEWVGLQGVEELAKSTIGSQPFVADTQLITPSALVLTLHPFLDPFYTVSAQGFPQMTGHGPEINTVMAAYPEVPWAEYAQTSPDQIPVNAVLPSLEKKLTQISDALGLDSSEALMGHSIPHSASQAAQEAEKDVSPAAKTGVEKARAFIQKHWLLLALIGGAVYINAQKKGKKS